MTQPTERRFVMEPRLDAEVETLNTAIGAEETARIAADALKVAKAGDTMTGALVLPADPTNNLEAATKQYVDATVAGGTTSGSRTVYVKAGMALAKGQPVYISGANGTNVIVSAAGNGSEATSSKTIGLINTTVANNGFAYVTTNGLLSGLDTSGATAEGDAVWLGPSGTLLYGLANKPYAPAHLVYIGVVTKKNASTGEILINPQNGFELNEIHDVLLTSPSNGQALTYDSATSLWKNATPISSLAGLSDVTLTSPVADQVLKYNGTDWVNGVGGGGASVTVSDTAPATPEADALWYDSTDGTLYVYYEDVNGSQWVQVQANSALTAGIESRLGALESQAIAFGSPSPNYAINGGFDIWQRGTSGFTSGYFADRWFLNGANSGSRSTDVPSSNFLYSASASNTSASFAGISQRIEAANAKELVGKTVTVSAWFKRTGTTAGNSLTVNMDSANSADNFGATTYLGFAGLTLSSPSTSWTRYSATFSFAAPSSVANGVQFTFKHDGNSGSNLGGLWAGIQIEVGSIATAFRRNANTIQAELAACQRYYVKMSGSIKTSYNIFNSGNCQTASIFFPVTMRVAPSSVIVTDTSNNVGKVTIANAGGASQANITPPANQDVYQSWWGYNSGGLGGTTGSSGMMFFNSYEASAEL